MSTDLISTGLRVDEFCAQVRALTAAGEPSAALEMIVELVYAVISDDASIARVFSSSELDALCLEIGRRTVPAVPRYDPELAIFLVTALYKTGGHTRVLMDLMNADGALKKIVVITNVRHSVNENEIHEIFADQEVDVRIAPAVPLFDRVGWLQDLLCTMRPDRTYIMQHHYDSVSIAACQAGLSERFIYLHHCDHSLALGVHLPHTLHVDFNAKSFYACRERHGISNNERWPLTVPESFDAPPSCFLRSGCLTTATSGGSEKFLRSHSKGYVPYSFKYEDVIPFMLESTGGVHFHIGALPPEALDEIRPGLVARGVHPEKFVHVPFARGLARTLRDVHADVYLTSFPWGGGRACVEAMSAGLPILAHANYRSVFLTDQNEIYPEALRWRTPSELKQRLCSLTLRDLQSHAACSFRFYNQHHRPDALRHAVAATLKAGSLGAPRRICDSSDPLQTFLDERFAEQSRLDAVIRPLRSALLEAQAAQVRMTADLEETVRQRDKAILSRDQALELVDLMTLSTSWRITRPLREIASRISPALRGRVRQVLSEYLRLLTKIRR